MVDELNNKYQVPRAIAATLVSICTDVGVMAPGAGGFITLWPPNQNPVVIDAYAEMPGRGLPTDRFGKGVTQVTFDYGGLMSTLVGYGTVATPGIFAGLERAVAVYGCLPWADIVVPAIRWAEQGFPLSGGAGEYLSCTHEAIFSWHPESDRAVHHPEEGRCWQVGDKVRIPHLANSLRQIAEAGAAALYTGALGQRIATEMQTHDGLLTAADLAAYREIVRQPTQIQFQDWDIVTNPPPAVGGICLAAMLLLSEHAPRSRVAVMEPC